jgi:hypothetical protein
MVCIQSGKTPINKSVGRQLSLKRMTRRSFAVLKIGGENQVEKAEIFLGRRPRDRNKSP